MNGTDYIGSPSEPVVRLVRMIDPNADKLVFVGVVDVDVIVRTPRRAATIVLLCATLIRCTSKVSVTKY